MKQSVWFAILLTSFLMAGRASGATYYISSSTGLDANTAAQAQSKSTPWAHLPCMANASGNSKTYTPVAGDRFVLKGGDSWANASFPCTWNWSGIAGNNIVIGVDQTWYAGSAWTRPIWKAGGAAITGSGAMNVFIDFRNANYGMSYVTLDNIEMTGFYWTGAPSYGYCAHIVVGPSTYITLDHLYVHSWSHDTYANGTRDSSCYIVLGNTNSPYAVGSVLQNSVIDGSDSTGGGDSIAATYAFPSIKNTIMHDLPNMLLPSGHGEISGNHLYNCKASFDVATHTNLLQTIGADGTYYIHDNVIHDGPCETIFLGNPNETSYVWNNVIYNATGNGPALDQSGASGTSSQYWWNNTIVPPAGALCLRRRPSGGLAYTNFYWQNNHCITTNADDLDTSFAALTTTLVDTNNVLQTPTIANNQGYTSSQIYAYSPVSANVSTVDKGINLTSYTTGPLSSLSNDTSYGQAYNSVFSAVAGPARTRVSKPSSGAVSVGAYQQYSDGLLPSAPTDLRIQ